MNLALPIPRINVRHIALALVLAVFASIATAMPVDQMVPEPVVTAIDTITPDFLDELVGTSQAEAWGWAKSAWNGVKSGVSWAGNYVSNNWRGYLAGGSGGLLFRMTCIAATGGLGAIGCTVGSVAFSQGIRYIVNR